MRALNQIQTLTPEQQQRCYFAVIASDRVQADGTRQNVMTARVRMRDGSFRMVSDLPKIDKDNPQPNGDYSITVDNNHSDDVADQSGIGWLFIGNDGMLHMMYCLSTNPAANSIRALADDGMLQFSTEGYLENMTDDGRYGNFWITAVAPVKLGNDPGTQSVENMKGNKMADPQEKNTLSKEEVMEMIHEHLSTNAVKDPADVMTAVAALFKDLGITDTKWIADITSDALSAAAGLPYQDDGAPAPADTTGATDPNAPVASENSAKEKRNAMTQRSAGTFKPQVSQPGIATAVVNDFSKRKNSPEYVEAWGRDLLEGMGQPHFNGVGSHLTGWFKTNDITFSPESVDLVPEVVIDKITELLQSSNNILSHITMYNGTNQYTVPSFVTATSYAHGRAKGAVAEKVSQTATVQPRLITAQTLFKYVSLPADFVDNSGGMTGSAVVDWVTRELPAKVIRAAEEALIVGGVKNDDSGATPFTAISSIVTDVTALNSPYGSVYTPASGESLLSSLSTQVASVELLDNALTNTGIYVVLSRTTFRKLMNQAVLGDGNYPANLATSPDAIASFLGVDGIIQVPWLRSSAVEAGHNANIDTFTSTYQALIVNLSAVYGVGTLTPQALSQYYLRANTYDFESKVRLGAALGAPHSAVLIKNAPAASGE